MANNPDSTHATQKRHHEAIGIGFNRRAPASPWRVISL